MFKEESNIMNDHIRRAIRHRARRAVSKDDLVRAVFETFRAQQIELRNVSLEDMKAALVEAARSAREHNPVAA
jgi:hypothetical protein